MTSSDTPGPGGCLRAWGQGRGGTWGPWGEARGLTWGACTQEDLELVQEECILEEVLEECILVWDIQAWDPWEECHQAWEDLCNMQPRHQRRNGRQKTQMEAK